MGQLHRRPVQNTHRKEENNRKNTEKVLHDRSRNITQWRLRVEVVLDGNFPPLSHRAVKAGLSLVGEPSPCKYSHNNWLSHRRVIKAGLSLVGTHIGKTRDLVTESWSVIGRGS